MISWSDIIEVIKPYVNRKTFFTIVCGFTTLCLISISAFIHIFDGCAALSMGGATHSFGAKECILVDKKEVDRELINDEAYELLVNFSKGPHSLFTDHDPSTDVYTIKDKRNFKLEIAQYKNKFKKHVNNDLVDKELKVSIKAAIINVIVMEHALPLVTQSQYNMLNADLDALAQNMKTGGLRKDELKELLSTIDKHTKEMTEVYFDNIQARTELLKTYDSIELNLYSIMYFATDISSPNQRNELKNRIFKKFEESSSNLDALAPQNSIILSPFFRAYQSKINEVS